MTANTTLSVVIARRKSEADGILSLDLVPVAGTSLPPFEAGSHIDVMIAPDLVRQYSLCNDPAESGLYRLGILLEPQSRGGSSAVHKSFTEGQTISISPPRNNFHLAETASRSILVAGGIGVTPLLAMAHRLTALGGQFDLHYCTRSRSRTAFTDHIATSPFAGRTHFHQDDGAPAQLFTAEKYLAHPEPGTHLYICGPKGFMDHVIAGAHLHGWPPERIHLEYFTADVSLEGDSLTVIAKRSGKTVQVPADKSIANALIDAGIDVPLSCEQGICGTCLTTVLEGIPDHRDMILSDDEKAENKLITVCCSRGKTPTLVLDI